MINYLFKNNVFALFLIVLSLDCYSQCAGCTVTNPTAGNYTFATNSVACFTSGTTTMSDVVFQNNSKICIASGATLIIQNNINSTSGTNVTFEIAGTLQFNQSPNINSSLTVNIANGGILRAGSGGNNNFTFSGTNNTVSNNGTIDVGVLGFSGNGTNLVDNYNLFSITQNINISGTTTFRNFGTINVGASYNNNSTSTYLNCGTINSLIGYNLGGGKIVNTGTFNVGNGSIDMSGTSRLENYGTFYSKGTINGASSSVIYNEGLMKITTWQPNGATMNGPTSSSKKGYTYFLNTVNPNGAKIGPNLDLTRYSQYEATMVKAGTQGQNAIFNSAPTYINSSGTSTTAALASVTYDCAGSGNCSAPVVTVTNICMNTDGSFPPVANNDTFAITAGASSATSVLANDLEQYNGVAASTSNVILTQVSASSPNVTLNTATGLVQVGSGVATGTYTINYQICRTSLPSSCSTAVVTVNVTGISTLTVCYKPGVMAGTALSTNAGITSLARANPGSANWPEVRKGAWLILESKTKGLVLNRLTTTQISGIPSADVKEGMVVYNTTLNCLQINTDGTAGGWKCFNTQTCPD
ncbi:hypothetical protein LUD75_15175 [Epilithonimonas sp. JDS]|uniref:hypothetical protein n=1 Tax=Epilithonimonas sp. JDS TaxID=2902797 RepID=UPI001E44EB67|nr:hypothetical protein [Epilithonimonas sp. JDS]MCD9856066.1 hypothetical protein [Epilithonimonas sp. JDS]